jgi:Domain of unknown function (DUF4181)
MNIVLHDIYQFIIYIVAFVIIFYFIEKLARKKWNIGKPTRSRAQGVNQIHTWGRRILWTVFFVSVVFAPSGEISVLLIMVIYAFDTYMQWKYDKAAKEYIITFLGLLLFGLFITIVYSFVLLW